VGRRGLRVTDLLGAASLLGTAFELFDVAPDVQRGIERISIVLINDGVDAGHCVVQHLADEIDRLMQTPPTGFDTAGRPELIDQNIAWHGSCPLCEQVPDEPLRLAAVEPLDGTIVDRTETKPSQQMDPQMRFIGRSRTSFVVTHAIWLDRDSRGRQRTWCLRAVLHGHPPCHSHQSGQPLTRFAFAFLRLVELPATARRLVAVPLPLHCNLVCCFKQCDADDVTAFFDQLTDGGQLHSYLFRVSVAVVSSTPW
jgi:hypothetical protein